MGGYSTRRPPRISREVAARRPAAGETRQAVDLATGLNPPGMNLCRPCRHGARSYVQAPPAFYGDFSHACYQAPRFDLLESSTANPVDAEDAVDTGGRGPVAFSLTT